VQTDDIVAKSATSGTVYYHRDGLGSTVALSDATGQIVERYRYDVFGRVEIRSATGESLPVSLFGNRFLFTGREHLSEVGLYDYRNRVYSAELGRFLQTDPIRFTAGDGNLYRYVGNNAVNLWDPWGLASRQSRPLDFLGPIKIGPLRHDRFKYDDGTDSGYYDDGKIRKDNPKNDEKYKDDKTGLDDNLLRKAEQKVKDNGWEKTPYDAIPFNGQKDHQCQNYCDEVLKEYEKLKNEQDANKCE
jgi:RHS repeat-associated protein